MIIKITKVGYWSGIVAFAAVVAYDIAHTLQVVGVSAVPSLYEESNLWYIPLHSHTIHARDVLHFTT